MSRGDFGWDYPPGVTGREPQIAGPNEDECAICGEELDQRDGDRAEMHDPDDPLNGGLVHPECGISAGWEIS